jgi:hypothetical protein
MSTFVTLPSGLRVNTSHILHYRYIKENDSVAYTRITLSHNGEPESAFVFDESIDLEQMDALLNPQQSPIVSPVLELRLPRPGEPVCFKWDGRWIHGIVQSPQVEDDKIIIVSDGVEYQYDLPSSFTVKLQ